MDGTYKITMSTPIGTKSGTLNLQTVGDKLTGTLFAEGSETPLTNGKVNGNNFEFSGKLKTGLGDIDYIATGTVSGDTLQANARTRFGMLHISGVRIST